MFTVCWVSYVFIKIEFTTIGTQYEFLQLPAPNQGFGWGCEYEGNKDGFFSLQHRNVSICFSGGLDPIKIILKYS